MSAHIEDYALLGNCRSAALVSRDGSLDWLCLPRFDAPAVFAALLGNEENGRWRLAPCDPVEHSSRQYLDDTLVLETTWVTASGRARVLDFMPLGEVNSLVRIVEGLAGETNFEMDLVMRFDYGTQRALGRTARPADPQRRRRPRSADPVQHRPPACP